MGCCSHLLILLFFCLSAVSSFFIAAPQRTTANAGPAEPVPAQAPSRYSGLKDLQEMNPVRREYMKNKFFEKLTKLNKSAARTQRRPEVPEEKNKYRNCYFSPVQCHLPVFIKVDALTTALQGGGAKGGASQDGGLSRFRRISYY